MPPVSIANSAQPAPFTPHWTKGNMSYFGGPLIQNIQVYPLWWGEARFQSKLEVFYNQFVAHCPMIDWIRTDYSTPRPLQIISRGKGHKGRSLKGYPKKKYLIDVKDLHPYLLQLVKTGFLKPTPNTYFPIHFAQGVSITINNAGTLVTSCDYFDGVHTTLNITSLRIPDAPYLYYGILPDCGHAFDVTTNVASHEVVEAITDPAAGLARANLVPDALPPAFPIAWNDRAAMEVGDLCADAVDWFKGTDGVRYQVQGVWSNSRMRCRGVE
ncbi:hypothetical protein BC830DRAFT_1156581 [Chytriomyces sp. MP71]|nr:hypothetical protein BC830DRAFT_1156581 [Chytriomyces sp. MP71]